jgi:guanylate kinase
VFIFIVPPSQQELEERLTHRAKDSSQDISVRLACYSEEMTHMNDYDYAVINENVPEAVEKLAAIVIAERCKTKRFNRGN